ncbi:MAG: hypothetical protein J6A04_03035 [Clostridia bacterium]|nr:hypothetical protein [Clostridia bacterium]
MRNIEITEMTLTIEEDGKELGKMEITFMDKEKCMFVPNQNLRKSLSTEEMKNLQNRILERLEFKWAEKRVKIG